MSDLSQGLGEAGSVETGYPIEPTALRQPELLQLPTASREATADEIEELRRFHLGFDRRASGEVLPSLWSWLLQDEPADQSATRPAVPDDLAEPLARLWRRLSRRESAVRSQWLEEARRLRRGLRSLLQRHPNPDAEGEADRLRHGLGDIGAQFVDPAALSSRLKAGADALSSERRSRIEKALERLDRIDRPDTDSSLNGVLVCDSTLARRFGAGALGDSLRSAGPPPRLELADEPCGHLAEAFDRRAAEIAEGFAAARVARLELENAYQPDRHDEALAAFDWQAFHREELAALPPLVAVLTADTMSGASLGPLVRLLLSGRPVQVVVLVDPASSPGAGLGLASNAYRFEPGLFALGLRKALIHQGSIAQSQELEEACAHAADATVGSLFVLATPSLSGPALEGPCHPELDTATLNRVAVASRAHPQFTALPEGRTPRRVSLGAAPEAAGPEDLRLGGWSHVLALVGDRPAENRPVRCTFADYALACGCFAQDFRAVDDELHDERLVTVEEWMDRPETETHDLLPFVWSIDTGKPGVDTVPRLRRLVVSRRLALCARDRLATWQTLISFAGRPEAVRAETTVVPEGPRPVAPPAPPEEQRRAIAQEIVAKLVAALVADPRAPSAPATQPPDA